MINDKLRAIQSRLVVPKNKKNNFGNYKYRNLDGILDALNPILKDLNCSCILEDTVEMIGDRFYVKSTAILQHKDEKISCSSYAREAVVKKGMDEAQITGASSSYARKYALAGLFSIGGATDKDYDSYDNSGEGENAGSNASDSGANQVGKPSPPKSSNLLSELHIDDYKGFIDRARKSEDKIIEKTIKATGETVGLIIKDIDKIKKYAKNNKFGLLDRQIALGALSLKLNDKQLKEFAGV